MWPHSNQYGVSTLLSGLHFKHVCIVNAQGQVEHLVSPDVDVKIERVPEPLFEKLRAGDVEAALTAARGTDALLAPASRRRALCPWRYTD